VNRKITVREAEMVSRRIAFERARKHDHNIDPEVCELESKFKETLGTRVYIEKSIKGGKISIDFFSTDDLRAILDVLEKGKDDNNGKGIIEDSLHNFQNLNNLPNDNKVAESTPSVAEEAITPELLDDRDEEEKKRDDDTEIYSMKNFSI
jgi:hypothetical protein